MPKRQELSDEQIQTILAGVKSGMDYKDIAIKAKLPNAMTVTRFMSRRLIMKYSEAKDKQLAPPPGGVID